MRIWNSSINTHLYRIRYPNHILYSRPFSRFWKLDDDGVYLITLNIAKHPDFPASVATSAKASKALLKKAGNVTEGRSSQQSLSTSHSKHQNSFNSSIPNSPGKPVSTPVPPKTGSDEYTPPSVDAVITISPRRGETSCVTLY